MCFLILTIFSYMIILLHVLILHKASAYLIKNTVFPEQSIYIYCIESKILHVFPHTYCTSRFKHYNSSLLYKPIYILFIIIILNFFLVHCRIKASLACQYCSISHTSQGFSLSYQKNCFS